MLGKMVGYFSALFLQHHRLTQTPVVQADYGPHGCLILGTCEYGRKEGMELEQNIAEGSVKMRLG